MALKKNKPSARAPIVAGKEYHIACKKGDVAPFVLIPGDPGRVGKIAGLWDSSHEVAYHREYHTMTGKMGGVPISCTSSGIGAPTLAIAVDELCRIGAETFIRVGTCGGIQKDEKIGDLVITTGAVRLDGASRDMVIPEYPAVASFEVVMALIEAAEELKFPYHVGISASTDTFYNGQGRPALNNYLPSFKKNILKDMQDAGIKNFEMEASCLLTMASLFGKRAGAVCVIIANRVTDEFKVDEELEKRAGLVASRAVVILNAWDKKKKAKHKKFLYPKIVLK